MQGWWCPGETPEVARLCGRREKERGKERVSVVQGRRERRGLGLWGGGGRRWLPWPAKGEGVEPRFGEGRG